MKKKKRILFFVVVLFSVSLLFVGQWSETVHLFDSLPPLINKNMVYQTATLALTLIFLSIFRLTSKKEFTEHFRKGNISAPIQPERWIGIKPGVNESWEHFGRNFAVIITAVTAIIIFFQVIRQEELHWINGLKYRSGHQP